jgi:hypothetical protein
MRHPDQVLVGGDSAVIGLEGEPGQDFYETFAFVGLRHVVHLEPLAGAAAR